MNQLNKKEIHELCQKIKKENKNELEKFYDKYRKLIINIAFSIVKNSEDAEEISQIVFLKLLNLSEEKFPSNNEFSWLYTVTKNVTIEYIRKQKNTLNIDELYNIENPSNEINEIIDANVFNQMIDSLNEDEKEIISLKILSKLTFNEISKLLNIPIGTVQWKYYKSINTLKILITNLTMFLITVTIYISRLKSNLLYNKSNMGADGVIIDNEFSKFTLNSIQNTMEIEKNLSNNFIDISLLILSIIFLIISVIFIIIFIKHQQKRKKKTSKI